VTSAVRESDVRFRRILVANRGEVALRIIRACHEAGCEAIAVYSDADREALFVRHADEAVRIGEPEPLKSYLDQDAIVAAARLAKADAVHPGYGFLSENAAFARRCRDEGLAFIGPSPEAILGMGDKVRSRETVKAAGVPVIPGADHVSAHTLEAEAARIGFPVMLKASAGGGGKGIRIVGSAKELESAWDRVSSEAHGAFGSSVVYLEKVIERPRHVEVQVLGDSKGNVGHLFERECSVQRRHQKVIEETPSPRLDRDLRAAMCAAAIAAAKSVAYTNAGTVEFLVDQAGKFYFLEMNTRLQVEHAITEMTTGVDIVKEQIRIAAGLDPTVSAEVRQTGHAIECRICAEDPENNFAPSFGRIEGLQLPGGPSVRLDSALFPGMEVSRYYDSMLAKLCVWGPDRKTAIARMLQALSELKIAGVRTNVAFLGGVLRSEAFASGDYSTDIIPDLQRAGRTTDEAEDLAIVAGAVLEHLNRSGFARPSGSANGKSNPWKLSGRPAP
jgi:acetyl-CoA carboxylase, biotin carboxylase subunit